MENKKLYIVREFYAYTENFFEVDSINHIITTNRDKAIKKFNELKEIELDFIENERKKYDLEVYDEESYFGFTYTDIYDRKEITLEEYDLKDDVFLLTK